VPVEDPLAVVGELPSPALPASGSRSATGTVDSRACPDERKSVATGTDVLRLARPGWRVRPLRPRQRPDLNPARLKPAEVGGQDRHRKCGTSGKIRPTGVCSRPPRRRESGVVLDGWRSGGWRRLKRGP
jgi:hypothetical protein